MAAYSDRRAKVAHASDKYSKRLQSITDGIGNDAGIKPNYKVYLTRDVNAFAMADGSIRDYSGLLDLMDDSEVRCVLGHEMGHVKLGHSKSRMQAALAASASRKAVASSGGRAGALADSDAGALMEKVVLAQYSQSNETQADDFAMQFMRSHKFERRGCVTAMEKLANISKGGGANWLSTHPAPEERAARMRKQLG
jgi:putative metalloprotease